MRGLLLISFFLLLNFGCFNSPKKNGRAFVKVNNKVLTLEEAKAHIPEFEFKADSVAAYTNYKERWVKNQLVLQEANRIKLLDSPEVHERVERAKQEMLFIAFQEAVLSSLEDEIQVSDEEARNYYQQNKDQFLLDERYIRFRHVITENLSDAENAKQELMSGVDWETVANKYSLKSDLVINNSKRFWSESSALKEFTTLNRYLRIIGNSEISIIENINDRYHFVQLMEERAVGEHPDLEWLLGQIKDWLILEKKRIAYNTYVKNLYLAAEANNEIRSFDVLPKNLNTEYNSDSLNSN